MAVTMQELLYLEIPTPNTKEVCQWLQQVWQIEEGDKTITPDGICLKASVDVSASNEAIADRELSIFVWSLQRTTYLKVFRWGEQPFPQEKPICRQLTTEIQKQFPPQYPAPPKIDLSQQSIFEALADDYPQTVKYFQKMPRGEYDLQRVYWWEQRWRQSVRSPQQPKPVLFPCSASSDTSSQPEFDLIYIGGALGAIHAATMAQKGYRVLLVERLAFGRMNREWNISRDEFQSLIDIGLFTPEEFESIITREYVDGFSKFFDGNNPAHLKAPILHTPTVLNVAIDTSKLLQLCGEKLREAGAEIYDQTEFIRADIEPEAVKIQLVHLPEKSAKDVRGRLLIDAMGTASPIAWQLNGIQTFNSVCPTVGAIVEGFAPEVWDPTYGDVLNSHGDISRGRQLIWELFPGEGDELTIYLFHYHEVHPDNPGSLLEMYEDFFTILPEYRRCNLDQLAWKKPTFGYIPGHFSVSNQDRSVAWDRVLSIGDAASLQSPLIFTGFGSLVRNLPRLTTLLDKALQNDLLDGKSLGQIRAYQSNIAVTWLFSKGMMVPTGETLPPERINAMLNTFFGLLAAEDPDVADTFIKDRTTWLMFTRLALKAARKNPLLLLWIWEMAGTNHLLRWLGSYASFSLDALKNLAFAGWFPDWLEQSQSWLESRYPALWLRLLSFRYGLYQ